MLEYPYRQLFGEINISRKSILCLEKSSTLYRNLLYDYAEFAKTSTDGVVEFSLDSGLFIFYKIPTTDIH